MATSNTAVANYALRHLGQGKTIAALDTESSAEAKACRAFFDEARDVTLQTYMWPFATVYVALGLVEEDPTSEWQYSYRYPSNCLHVRRILSGSRNDTRQSRISYEIAQDDTGRLIYADQEDATIEYTKREDDVSLWPADFTLAFSYKLAALIAPSIMGTASQKMREMEGMFDLMISRAAAREANEQQQDEEPLSEFERSR